MFTNDIKKRLITYGTMRPVTIVMITGYVTAGIPGNERVCLIISLCLHFSFVLF